jgi:hypothetical protein
MFGEQDVERAGDIFDRVGLQAGRRGKRIGSQRCRIASGHVDLLHNICWIWSGCVLGASRSLKQQVTP